ncbi:hypothetical protein PENTCL1PPCAC_3228 [Pristionchus entomophagus]|uniref:Uncharacterized protein n=1 Tax=Pristionchus entomophagus TaxID=358040 RepID=A0AAV5SFU1_9BILA|nr:hypothetical protein PENTCL1PPCAC_3228 [Pristionchus entomophagus]
MDLTKTVSSICSLRSSTMSSLPMDDAFVASRREHDQWLSTLAPLLSSTEQQLWDLWDKHDFDEELRDRRKHKSEEIVRSLLEDMLTQEQKMGEKLGEQIRVGRRKVNDLRAQLGLPPFNESAYPPESVRLWRLLEAESVSLAKQVEDMEARIPQLEKKVEELRRRLGEEKKEIELKIEQEEDKENALAHVASLKENPLHSLMEGVSTDEEKSPIEKEKERQVLCKRVSRLETRFHRLTRELEDRKERVRVAQFEIRERTARIGDSLLSSDVADVISHSIDSIDSVITKGRVERAEEAREVVAFKYREWAERESFAYDELYMQLHELWDACHIPERERTLPKRFLPEKHSHSDVEKARVEVERLSVMREERAHIHEALDKWMRLWNEKVHFEQESEQRAEAGVSKYANRAGTLLKAMKRANQLEKVLLPGAAICLQTACEEYKERRGGEECRMHGMTPMQYIDFVKREHTREKEERRAERQAARKAGLNGGPSSINMTKSPWMPSGGRSASRLVPTAFSTTRLPTTPYAGMGGGATSTSRMGAMSRVAASTSVLHGVKRSPMNMRAPTTPTALMQTPSRSKFLPLSSATPHTPNTSVLTGRVRKSLSKGQRMSPKKFFTPILSSLSPIHCYSNCRPTASPLSMTSSSGFSSMARPSTTSPSPYRVVVPMTSSRGGVAGIHPSSSRLPPLAPKTPMGSALGSLSRTPRYV